MCHLNPISVMTASGNKKVCRIAISNSRNSESANDKIVLMFVFIVVNVSFIPPTLIWLLPLPSSLSLSVRRIPFARRTMDKPSPRTRCVRGSLPLDGPSLDSQSPCPAISVGRPCVCLWRSCPYPCHRCSKREWNAHCAHVHPHHCGALGVLLSRHHQVQ